MILICGATGAGKSRLLFMLTTNLAYNSTNKEVNFYLSQNGSKQDVSKFKDLSLREKIGARVSGKTTADIDKSLETEIAYVREMGGFNNLPAPRTPAGGSGSDDAESVMKSMFGVKDKK
jgi:ABC-type molybdenum transport system ATPase subunit/photorepair protein PhrA